VLYDVFNDDRSDLEAYVTIAEEVEAHRVVDVGCGTGSLAVRLAELGFSVPLSRIGWLLSRSLT
jgi:2-polyprenyl-3-methyl-5-hydroxy-6-metoxy-1,4-benzoquinol methylase